jgi:hypothetical protein
MVHQLLEGVKFVMLFYRRRTANKPHFLKRRQIFNFITRSHFPGDHTHFLILSVVHISEDTQNCYLRGGIPLLGESEECRSQGC